MTAPESGIEPSHATFRSETLRGHPPFRPRVGAPIGGRKEVGASLSRQDGNRKPATRLVVLHAREERQRILRFRSLPGPEGTRRCGEVPSRDRGTERERP